MSDRIMEFGDVVRDLLKDNPQVSTLWAVVVSHNNDNTFDCKSVSDDLEYYDVLQGLSSFQMKPKKDSKCLIGIIGNSHNAFLIVAEEIEKYYLKANDFDFEISEDGIKINGDDFNGLVKAPELKKQIDKNTELLKKIQQSFSAWTPISQDGGTALKTISQQFSNLPTADLSNIENENVKHG